MKTLFEQIGGTYVQDGDYLIPNLSVPTRIYNIGKYGRLHEAYLKQNYPNIYSSMLMNGTLLEYLENLDKYAQAEVNRLVADIAKKHNISEELKKTNQLEWVCKMNNILHSAEEIIFKKTYLYISYY